MLGSRLSFGSGWGVDMPEGVGDETGSAEESGVSSGRGLVVEVEELEKKKSVMAIVLSSPVALPLEGIEERQSARRRREMLM